MIRCRAMGIADLDAVADLPARGLAGVAEAVSLTYRKASDHVPQA
jgi:hypothetical protein